MSPDAVVDKMRNNTSIKSRGSPLVMTISFSASDPRVTAAVVNEYVTLILEASVRQRTGQAEETLAFFDQEVERLSTELTLISGNILEFKTANAESLPETLNYRQNQQNILQQRLARLERDKNSTSEQRDRIIQIFKETGKIEVANRNLSPEEKRLEQLNRELDSAKVLYSATNPRVRILEGQIASLEEVIQAQISNNPENSLSAQEALFNQTITEFNVKIEDTDRQIMEVREELTALEESIARTPSTGIALSTLQRDYSNTQSQYNQAINRRATASMGERIELSSNGQRVTLVESAPVPNKPSSPNRPMVAATGIGAGLAAAAGLFLLLELLNRTVRYPAELTAKTQITPLAVIPYMETALRRNIRRGARIAVFVLVVIGVPAGLWIIDSRYRPLELMAREVFQMIGLG